MSDDSKKNCDWCDSDKEKDIFCEHDKCNKCDEDCCCDIDTLRKILKLLREEDIIVAIATKTDIFGEFIFDIANDVVFISNAANANPTEFVPLCNIVRVFAEVDGLADNVREELMGEIEDLIRSTCNLNRCCCTDGLADTINDIRKFNSNSNNLLCFNLDANVDFAINPDNCFEIGNIVKANADVVFAIFEDNFFIYPTCAIDSMHLEVPVP